MRLGAGAIARLAIALSARNACLARRSAARSLARQRRQHRSAGYNLAALTLF